MVVPPGVQGRDAFFALRRDPEIQGGVGGYMDSHYSEPFGLIFGGALAAMQVLDYNGVGRFGWNPQPAGAASSDLLGFVGDQMAVVGGFAVGYFVGFNAAEWFASSKEAFEQGVEEGLLSRMMHASPFIASRQTGGRETRRAARFCPWG